MKKFTKKQMIATGAVAILVIGGVSAGVANHNHSVWTKVKYLDTK